MVTGQLFRVQACDDGVVSVEIATDDAPYLGPAWVEGFAATMESLGHDESVRSVILVGTARYFSAGADPRDLERIPAIDTALTYGARAVETLLDFPLPVVAAAAGHAVGGGLMLAAWSDAVVLANESLYSANFIKLGFVPGMGATHVIPELFGPVLGRTLLYSGCAVTGREVVDAHCPLSRAVHPRAQVVRRALSLAGTIAEGPRRTLAQLKQVLSARRRQMLEQSVAAERAANRSLFADPGPMRGGLDPYPLGSEIRSPGS